MDDSEAITVSTTTPVDAAVTLMTEYGFHRLLVVDDERPVGMLGPAKPHGMRLPGTGIGLGF